MIGILSDAHGNVEAFDRAVDILKRHGAKRIIFLGDSVGYFPSDAVVNRLIETDMEALMGNHEQMLTEKNIPSEKDVVYKLAQTLDSLAPSCLEYLHKLPKSIRFNIPSGELLFVHGSPVDEVNGYIYPDTSLASLATNLTKGLTIFCGHTHWPFVRHERDVRFINVGSCALPRDQGNYGAAGLLDADSGDVRILRFCIAKAWDLAIARCPDVHPDVRGLIKRRRACQLVGEIVN